MNYKIKTLGIEFPRGRRAAPLAPPVAAVDGQRRSRRRLALRHVTSDFLQPSPACRFAPSDALFR